MRRACVPSRQAFVRHWLVAVIVSALQAAVPAARADTALQGAAGGVLSTFTIPDKGKLIAIDVYLGNGIVTGVKFSYYPNKFSPILTESDVYGTARGNGVTVQRFQVPRNDATIKSAILTWGARVSSISLIWPQAVNAPSTFGVAGPNRAEVDFPPGSEISAARIRADAQGVFAIAFDTRPSEVAASSGTTIAAPLPNGPPTQAAGPPTPAPGGDVFAGVDDKPTVFAFAGIWQYIDRQIERIPSRKPEIDGDGCQFCSTFNVPPAVRITAEDAAARQIRVRFQDLSEIETVLTRVDSTDAASMTWMKIGGGMTATFTVAGATTHLYLKTPNPKWTGTYAGRGALDTDPKAKGKGDFNALSNLSSVIGGYANILHGYDGPLVNLMSPGSGKSDRLIFKDPPSTDHWISHELASPRAIPTGLEVLATTVSATDSREITVASEAETHKTTGASFGVSGGAGGASVGINYSKTLSSGLSNSTSNMQSFALSRIVNYTLLLDFPALHLHDDFVFAVTNLRGAKDAGYDTFVDNYGTHYANAIMFGGVGRTVETVAASEYVKWKEQQTSLGVEGGAEGAKADFKLTNSQGDKQGSGTTTKSQSFLAACGTGSTSREFWQVPLDTSCPMAFDLRPIGDLVNGLWFDWPEQALQDVQTRIAAAVKRHMAKLPPLSTEPGVPVMYRVEALSLYCDRGIDGGSPARLIGKVSVAYTDDHGGGTYDFYDTGNSISRLPCDGKTALPINKSTTIWAMPKVAAQQLSYTFKLGGLVNADYDPKNADEFFQKMSNFFTGTDESDKFKIKDPPYSTRRPAASTRPFEQTNDMLVSKYGAKAPELRLVYRVSRVP